MMVERHELEGISPERITRWAQLGVDVVKHDLLNGGYRFVGGPPEIRDQAWRWVRYEEARKRESEAVAQPISIKPGAFGVSFDVVKLWRLAKQSLMRRGR